MSAASKACQQQLVKHVSREFVSAYTIYVFSCTIYIYPHILLHVYVSSYTMCPQILHIIYICPHILLHMCPHTGGKPAPINTLINLPSVSTPICVSSYTHICVRIQVGKRLNGLAKWGIWSAYYTCVRILYMCPHTRYVCAFHYICVLILLYRWESASTALRHAVCV